MKKYRLVATDLDGTLLDKNGTLGADTLEAISELTKRGVHCAIATGRAYSEIPEALCTCPEIRYIIYSNGAALLDKESGEQIKACIEKKTLLQMIPILEEYEVQICVHVNGCNYYDARYPLREYQEYFHLPDTYIRCVLGGSRAMENIFDFMRAHADAVEVFSLYFRNDEVLSSCAARLSALGGLYITYTAGGNFEIFDQRAGKDRALQRLSRHTGIPVSQMITVGDSDNDTAMTRAAGLGLAVKDASPALLSVADGVICEGGDGVMRFVLEHYFSEDKSHGEF
jgi:Cof subfamily protein (haloacid dehalogenase superfamily)